MRYAKIDQRLWQPRIDCPTIGTMSQYKVFVSHGSADVWVAGQIGRRIREDCQASTFLDAEDIASGDNFKQRVHAELQQAQELVALFTPWSVGRTWVWIEIGAAWAQEKRVIAVLYGLSLQQFEEAVGGRAVFEDLHILQLNDFSRYLDELQVRVVEARDAE